VRLPIFFYSRTGINELFKDIDYNLRIRLKLFLATIARVSHLFPFRTEQLSPSTPMVLDPQGPGRVGSRQNFIIKASSEMMGLFFCAFENMPAPDSPCPLEQHSRYPTQPLRTEAPSVATIGIGGCVPRKCGRPPRPASFRRAIPYSRRVTRLVRVRLARLETCNSQALGRHRVDSLTEN
jgi:hypothetical protein